MKEAVLNTKNNIEYYTFPALSQTGIVDHLFTTRKGGVSEGIFSTMNLSLSRGDKKEAVLENYRKVAALFEKNIADIVTSDQTHTTNVRVCTKLDAGKGLITPRDYTDIDGLITNEPGLILATFYADCVPLYMVDPVHKAIGLSHSGWRGTVNKMGKATILSMQENYGTNPADVICVIGPSICQSCYEVSEDVIIEFRENFGSKIAERLYVKNNQDRFQLDLWEANRQVFLESGVREENIHVSGVCTCCNAELLFSHRASQGKRGNLGAFMCLK